MDSEIWHRYETDMQPEVLPEMQPEMLPAFLEIWIAWYIQKYVWFITDAFRLGFILLVRLPDSSIRFNGEPEAIE